jgi:DNA-binding ferritin-like protein
VSVFNGTKGGRSMSPNIGLVEKQREGVVGILNTILADEYLLYTKTRHYHLTSCEF